MLLRFHREDSPDVDDHDARRQHQEGHRRILQEVHVAENQALKPNKAQNERIRAEGAAADFDRIHFIVEHDLLAGDVNRGAAKRAERPEEGQAGVAEEAELRAAELEQKPNVDGQLEEILLVEGVREERVDEVPVVVGQGEVVDHPVARLVARGVHDEVDERVADQEKHHDVDGVERLGERKVAAVGLRVVLLLFLLLLLLAVALFVFGGALLERVDALDGTAVGASGFTGGGVFRSSCAHEERLSVSCEESALLLSVDCGRKGTASNH